MAIQLKMRYRYTGVDAWHYPPSTPRGVPAADTSDNFNLYEATPVRGNTMPALDIPVVHVTGNEIVSLVGSKRLEKDGGFGLEVNPSFILQRISAVNDENLYAFLRLYDQAPLKQIGYYNTGYGNRFISPLDSSIYMMDVVTKQTIDVGKKDKGNRIGVTLHLESAYYFSSDSVVG